MRTTKTTYNLTVAQRFVHVLVFFVALLSLSLHNLNARAATPTPDEYRTGKVVDKFDDTWQFAAAYKLRPPRRLRASYLELALGVITAPGESHALISLGPVWQFPVYADRVSLNLSISPTLLSGTSVAGRDMGGNFHFTSAASLETSFGVRRAFSVALRIQHTSNGGLSGSNPGMDIIGLDFSYDLGAH